MDLDNEELQATKEISADEMFERLGYVEKIEDDSVIKFIRDDNRTIIFHLDYKIFYVEHKDFEYFTIKELQAINKKCKELGWI